VTKVVIRGACERCFACYGTGMVSDYGDGCDFYGPKECDCCCGNGCYWITPRGRHVLYPGRPVLLIKRARRSRCWRQRRCERAGSDAQ
jgi:hypothetical protein